ncbi:hypothetical protein SAMN04488146_11520 [Bacillus nitratireducens]|nr:hypothetical protein SAMN04488146_11520 [Bacillus nitratireducens]
MKWVFIMLLIFVLTVSMLPSFIIASHNILLIF